MEEFALVEADFQQYYQLNLEQMYRIMISGSGFLRYARLFSCLPVDSRINTKLSPASTWTWQDDTLSDILYEIRALNKLYYNAHRKSGTAPEKVDPPKRPEYVQEAIEEYQAYREEQKRIQSESDVDMRDFWQSRNPSIKFS